VDNLRNLERMQFSKSLEGYNWLVRSSKEVLIVSTGNFLTRFCLLIPLVISREYLMNVSKISSP